MPPSATPVTAVASPSPTLSSIADNEKIKSYVQSVLTNLLSQPGSQVSLGINPFISAPAEVPNIPPPGSTGGSGSESLKRGRFAAPSGMVPPAPEDVMPPFNVSLPYSVDSGVVGRVPGSPSPSLGDFTHVSGASAQLRSRGVSGFLTMLYLLLSMMFLNLCLPLILLLFSSLSQILVFLPSPLLCLLLFLLSPLSLLFILFRLLLLLRFLFSLFLLSFPLSFLSLLRSLLLPLLFLCLSPLGLPLPPWVSFLPLPLLLPLSLLLLLFLSLPRLRLWPWLRSSGSRLFLALFWLIFFGSGLFLQDLFFSLLFL